jgi:hypothetical protein
MIGLLRFILGTLASTFKSKSRLEAENAVLRHQLIVLRRKMHGQRPGDHFLFRSNFGCPRWGSTFRLFQ